ncbi:MAG: hypothetical protein HKN72_08805 [Gemmatimonadetes bacterium]|nr:hypothetical protein [Gemmatimonadota bacterium]
MVPMIRRAVLFLAVLAVAACGAEEEALPEGEPSMTAAPMEHDNRIISLLASGQPVFGMFAPEQSADGGVQAAANDQTDFIFYSLESGPWDIPTMETFMASMAEAAGGSGSHPVVLRIPPIRDDRDAARTHLEEGLAAGIDGLVLPHVETVEDVALATEVAGDRLWPLNPDGDVLNVILIEDQSGIALARDLVGAPGVGVAIPGPGDLRRAYEGDMDAVENAIQTVLAACKEFDVPCGITAGPDDIAERLEQGFEMIIVTEPEALAVGLQASGRGG